MRLGMFGQASHPPGKSPYDCQEWDLQVVRWLDELGYDEAWFGEHHTLPWEPNPAPDILIAQAFRETSRIRLGPGGICLPYHNPAVVANRMAWLDHISRGRLNFGVAAGSVGADWKLVGINGADTRDMLTESLEIIHKIWSGERPFAYEGRFWRSEADVPNALYDAYLRPLQQPGPPIGIAGLSPNSPTLRIAGAKGYLPLSLNADLKFLRSQWDGYAEAAEAAGRTPSRADWRVCKEVIVAETDAKAEKIALESNLARFNIEFMAQLHKVLPHLKALGVPEEQLLPPWLARHSWIVGSPATVREKLEEYQHASGGFGVLLVMACDFGEQPQVWRDSLGLLATEVAPKFAETAQA